VESSGIAGAIFARHSAFYFLPKHLREITLISDGVRIARAAPYTDQIRSVIRDRVIFDTHPKMRIACREGRISKTTDTVKTPPNAFQVPAGSIT